MAGRSKGVSQSEDSEDGGHHFKAPISHQRIPATTSREGLHSLAHKMELIDRDRLLRLRRAAKVGDIVHTKRGVFHLTPCDTCGFHHKLSLSLKKQAPCPATEFGKRYYQKHPKEKLMMETFPLNRVINAKIPPTTGGSLIKKQSSMSLPKVSKSDDSEKRGKLVRPQSAASASRSKTSRGRQRLQEIVPSSKKGPAYDGVTWNDVFSESGLSSSEASSDIDNRDTQDADAMRRKLVREMFTQEEDALRFRLAKEREKFYFDVRTLRTHEREKALKELKSKRIMEELKRRFCLLVEQEIILGVAKVTLDEYYQQYRAFTKQSTKDNQKQTGSRYKLSEELKKEYLEHITSKESKITERERQMKAIDILKKKHEATPKISELKLAEVELQKKLSLEQQENYQQKVIEAKQQAKLQQKVQEARQLEQKLSQRDSKLVHPSMQAKLHQKVSEAQILHQKVSALKRSISEQQRVSNNHKFQLRQQLSQVRRQREQLSLERQADLHKKFLESKQAELAHASRSETTLFASQAKSKIAKPGLSNAKWASMELEQSGHQSELQKILKETLILDQQKGKHKRYRQEKSKGNTSVQTVVSKNLSEEIPKSRSAPKSQDWHTLPAATRNVEFELERKVSTEKGVQTFLTQRGSRPMHYEPSSSSTPLDSSGDDRGHFMRIGGPITVSPRPPSAHPMRRPDLYGKRRPYCRHDDDDDDDEDDIPEWTTTYQSTTSSTVGRNSIIMDARQSIKSCPAKHDPVPRAIAATALSEAQISKDRRLLLSKERRRLEQRREEVPTADESVGYSSSHEKKISFMVSLACGEDKQETDASVAPASSSDSMLTLTDEIMDMSSKIDSSSKSQSAPHANIIDSAREASSLIGHVDSLILIEQGVPEPPHEFSAKESQEVFEKVQAESCIVQHVDSLILIEQSLHQLDETGKAKEVKKNESPPKLEFVDPEPDSTPKMIPTSEVIKTHEEPEKRVYKRRVSISSQDMDEVKPPSPQRRVSISSQDQEVMFVEKLGKLSQSEISPASGKGLKTDFVINVSSTSSPGGGDSIRKSPDSALSRAATGSIDGDDSGFAAPPSTPTDYPQQALRNGIVLNNKTGTLCMADIQKELKELEDHISSLPLSRIEEAEADLVYAEDELNEAYASMARGDSVTIPQIFVSPARGLALTESQLILIKAQEYARDIIGNAIEINTGMDCGGEETLESCILKGIDSAETQVAFQAREIVQEIIETALEINNSFQSESILDINAQHLFESLDPEVVFESSMQEQALERAQELVNEAISKAVEMTSAVTHVGNVQTTQVDHREKRKQQLKAIESQMTMFKAQEIVNRVVGQALEMNLKKIHSEQLQARKKAKDIRSYKSSDHTVGKWRKTSYANKNIEKEAVVKKIDSTPVAAVQASVTISSMGKTTSSPTAKPHRDASEIASVKRSEVESEDQLPVADSIKRVAKLEDHFSSKETSLQGREADPEDQFPKAESYPKTTSLQRRQVQSEDIILGSSSKGTSMQRREVKSEDQFFRVADSSTDILPPLRAKKKSFSGRAKELIRASFQRRFKGTLEKSEERGPSSMPVVAELSQKQTKCPSCAELMHDVYNTNRSSKDKLCELHAPKKKRSFPTLAKWMGRKKASSSGLHAQKTGRDQETMTTGEEPHYMRSRSEFSKLNTSKTGIDQETMTIGKEQYHMHSISEFSGLNENVHEAVIQQYMLRAQLHPLHENAIATEISSDAKNVQAVETKVLDRDSVTRSRQSVTPNDSAAEDVNQDSYRGYGAYSSPPGSRIIHIDSVAPDIRQESYIGYDAYSPPGPGIIHIDSAAQGPREDSNVDHGVHSTHSSLRQRVSHIQSAAADMNGQRDVEYGVRSTRSSPRQTVTHTETPAQDRDPRQNFHTDYGTRRVGHIQSAALDMDGSRQDYHDTRGTHSSPGQMVAHTESAAQGGDPRQDFHTDYGTHSAHSPKVAAHILQSDMNDPGENFHVDSTHSSPKQSVAHVDFAAQDMDDPRQNLYADDIRSMHSPPRQTVVQAESAAQDMDDPRQDLHADDIRSMHSPPRQKVTRISSTGQDLEGPREHSHGEYYTHGSRQRMTDPVAHDIVSAHETPSSGPTDIESTETEQKRSHYGPESSALRKGSEVHVSDEKPKQKKSDARRKHHHKKARHHRISLQSKSESSGLNTTVIKHHKKHKDKFLTDELGLDDIRTKLESVPLPRSHRKKKDRSKSRASTVSPRIGRKKKKSSSRSRRSSKDTTSTRGGKKTRTNLIVPDSTSPSHSDFESISQMSDETLTAVGNRMALDIALQDQRNGPISKCRPRENSRKESCPAVAIVSDGKIKSSSLHPNHNRSYSINDMDRSRWDKPKPRQRALSFHDWQALPNYQSSSPFEKFYAISKKARRQSARLFWTRPRQCVSAPVRGDRHRYTNKQRWSSFWLTKHLSMMTTEQEPRRVSSNASPRRASGVAYYRLGGDSSAAQWKSAPVHNPKQAIRHERQHRDTTVKSSTSATSASGQEQSFTTDKQTSSSTRHHRYATSATGSTSGLDHSMVTDPTERSNLSMSHNIGKPIQDSTPLFGFRVTSETGVDHPEPQFRCASLPSNKIYTPEDRRVVKLPGTRSESLSGRRGAIITLRGSKKSERKV